MKFIMSTLCIFILFLPNVSKSEAKIAPAHVEGSQARGVDSSITRGIVRENELIAYGKGRYCVVCGGQNTGRCSDIDANGEDGARRNCEQSLVDALRSDPHKGECRCERTLK